MFQLDEVSTLKSLPLSTMLLTDEEKDREKEYKAFSTITKCSCKSVLYE